MWCCSNCIGDRGLARNIIPSLSTLTASCSFCQSENVSVVEPKALGDVFSSLIAIYEIDPLGSSLISILKEDWGLFDHEAMDEHRSKNLLAEILNDGEIVRRNFVPSPRFRSHALIRWEELRDELRLRNRFFPAVSLDLDRLSNLLSYLLLAPDELPVSWFRSRLLAQADPYGPDQMGAPPSSVATHGRANPAGIPYLYLASTETTAISEVRPHTGERTCIAEFSTPPDLKIVDLRNPRKSVSPFVLGDEEAIGAMRADIGFLARLGDELTRPVLPQSAAIDYVPSQYLCEFIKKCGYDGVMYRSSVGEGMNLALFDPAKATVGTISVRSVARVTVDLDAS